MFRGTTLQVATYLAVVCLLSISFLVFVNATASFIITDLLGKHKDVGNDVGSLGFADELVAMVACPVWGVVSDRIGARTVVVISYAIIALALFCFVNAKNVFPDLLLIRILFSMGAAGATTMVTAILPSLSQPVRNIKSDDEQVSRNDHDSRACDEEPPPYHSLNHTINEDTDKIANIRSGSFRIAGLVGTSAGCGALVALFGFVRLPAIIKGNRLTAAMALRDTYYIVGAVALLAALLAFTGLRRLASGSETAGAQQKRKFVPYWKMPYSAVRVAFKNRAVGLAYLGGFVARSSSVGISLFIPLWINDFFQRSGLCDNSNPDPKQGCPKAYILASIVGGVSQLAALLCAPLFGFLAEKYHRSRIPILFAAGAGIAGYAILASIRDPRLRDGPLGYFIFVVAALVGISQIGAIVCSLGLLGHAIALSENSEYEARAEHIRQAGSTVDFASTTPLLAQEHSANTTETNPTPATENDDLTIIKGSMSGMYSFGGGVGILLLTKLGGWLFDVASPAAPFWLLAGFNAVLLFGAGADIGAGMVKGSTRSHS